MSDPVLGDVFFRGGVLIIPISDEEYKVCWYDEEAEEHTEDRPFNYEEALKRAAEVWSKLKNRGIDDPTVLVGELAENGESHAVGNR